MALPPIFHRLKKVTRPKSLRVREYAPREQFGKWNEYLLFSDLIYHKPLRFYFYDPIWLKCLYYPQTYFNLAQPSSPSSNATPSVKLPLASLDGFFPNTKFCVSSNSIYYIEHHIAGVCLCVTCPIKSWAPLKKATTKKSFFHYQPHPMPMAC